MPDITIGSAIFLLTFAVTGIVLQTFIPLIIMLPAIFARFFVDQQHTIRDAFLWYFIPALVLILSGFVIRSLSYDNNFADCYFRCSSIGLQG